MALNDFAEASLQTSSDPALRITNRTPRFSRQGDGCRGRSLGRIGSGYIVLGSTRVSSGKIGFEQGVLVLMAPPPRVLSYRATISVPESTAHNINSWMSAPDGDGIALVHPGQQPWAVWYFVGGG